MDNTPYGVGQHRPTKYAPPEAICGIYSITHIETGFVYVGQSKDIYARWRGHIRDRSSTSRIAHALRREKHTAFNFEILCRCPPEKLNEYEAGWIDLMGSVYPQGFNANKAGYHKIPRADRRGPVAP